MWVFSPRGFYSGVQDKKDPNTIVIRARTDRHLKALMDLLPKGTKIVTGEGTDYPCRVRVSAADWIRICGVLAAETTYTNFKDAVEDRAAVKKHGRFDHQVYLGVWSKLQALTSDRERKARRAAREARYAAEDARPSRRRGRGRGYDEVLPSADTLFASFDPWPSDDPLRPGGDAR